MIHYVADLLGLRCVCREGRKEAENLRFPFLPDKKKKIKRFKELSGGKGKHLKAVSGCYVTMMTE